MKGILRILLFMNADAIFLTTDAIKLPACSTIVPFKEQFYIKPYALLEGFFKSKEVQKWLARTLLYIYSYFFDFSTRES